MKNLSGFKYGLIEEAYKFWETRGLYRDEEECNKEPNRERELNTQLCLDGYAKIIPFDYFAGLTIGEISTYKELSHYDYLAFAMYHTVPDSEAMIQYVCLIDTTKNPDIEIGDAIAEHLSKRAKLNPRNRLRAEEFMRRYAPEYLEKCQEEKKAEENLQKVKQAIQRGLKDAEEGRVHPLKPHFADLEEFRK